MIALAVAVILTITALAIWGVRVIRRPVDWSGPITAGPTLWSLQDTVNLRLATGGTIPADSWIDITPYVGCYPVTVTPGRPCDHGSITLTVKDGDALSEHLRQALRASERDDRRKEGR